MCAQVHAYVSIRMQYNAFMRIAFSVAFAFDIDLKHCKWVQVDGPAIRTVRSAHQGRQRAAEHRAG